MHQGAALVGSGPGRRRAWTCWPCKAQEMVRLRRFKFRLSTLLLLVTLCAVLFAWYADHYSYLRSDIVGTWRYPTRDRVLLGYVTTLQINRDGTFTKYQQHRGFFEEYAGTYTSNKSGTVAFHVNQKTSGFTLLSKTKELPAEFKLLEPKVSSVNVTFECRCAIDKTGHLVLYPVSSFGLDENGPIISPDIRIRWETYMPSNVRRTP